MWAPGYYGSHISISNLIFYTFPGIRDMTSLHVFIVLSLPYTQSLRISSVGCRNSRVQQFAAFFCQWLTLAELTMSHPVQQEWVGECSARSMSKHPALPTLSMGPDFTEGAEPGIGHCQWCSAQMCYLLYNKATPASSHLLCRGHISV